MGDISSLCYMNIKSGILDNTDFNFDNKYKFKVCIEKNNNFYKYILCAEKIEYGIPTKVFWGNNITSLHAIVGKNGAGKTSAINAIIDNIGEGVTSLNGEGIIYIVRFNDIYIVNSNCRELEFDSSINDLKINIKKFSDFFNELSECNSKLRRNSYFFNSFIFFSNYFGAIRNSRKNTFFIDVSKDNEVNNLINCNDKQYSCSLQKRIRDNQHLRLLDCMCDEKFLDLSNNIDIKIPNLIRFNLNTSDIEYDSEGQIARIYKKYEIYFYDKSWVSKERIEKIRGSMTLISNESLSNQYEFEVAINNFAVNLVQSWCEKGNNSSSLLNNFIRKLSRTKTLDGFQIIARMISKNEINISNESKDFWIKFLEFANLKENKFILNWQSGKELVYRWNNSDDIKLIKDILAYFSREKFCNCELVNSSDNENGIYSSGNTSKMFLYASLYEAYKNIVHKNNTQNKNILMLLDEIDTYYHPDFQVKLVEELIEFINIIFSEYNVQIILATNTPLELSDIPHNNIICLNNGNIAFNYNNSETFGANICNMLKDTFFLDSTMGNFARRKINKVIDFLLKDDNSISKDEVKYIIDIIGEPIIKDKLKEMYYKKFPDEKTPFDKKINLYKQKINELENYINNGQVINNEKMYQLKDKLFDVINDLNTLIKKGGYK